MNTHFASSWDSESAIYDVSSLGDSQNPLTSALKDVKNQLQLFFSSPDAFEQLNDVYDINDPEAAQSLIVAGALGKLSFPNIQLLDNETLKGARGAYSSQRNTIYLSSSLLENDPVTGDLIGVLLEEIGHSFDNILNPDADSTGDEGELFRNTVLGHVLDDTNLLRIRSENDWGTLVIEGEEIAVEQDNFLWTARNIGTFSGARNFVDFVGTSDPIDYYRFTLAQISTLNLTLNGLSADADVELLDISGNIVERSAASGSTAENILRSLSAGSYYVKVERFSSANTYYNLNLTATAIADNGGNTLGTALNLGTLTGTRNLIDFVGQVDSNDYFRFNVTNTSNFYLALNNLSADVDVQLLNSSGGVIEGSTGSGTSPEIISRQLTAGTYYVQVYPFDTANTYFNLSLTGNSLADNAGNTLVTARALGTLTGTQSFSNFVGSTDTNDYYRFNVTNTSTFGLTLDGLSADADVELLDINGAVLERSERSGSSDESISRQLTAGFYYVRVYPFSSANTNYNLTVRATSPDAAGNTLGTARTIGTLSSLQTFSDFVGSGDTNDYYRFNVTNTSNFSLTLNGLAADAEVELLNSSGGVIQSSTAGGSTAESINRSLSAGTYYVRVYPFSSANTNYTLSLSASSIPTVTDGAGNALATARNIGFLNGGRFFQDFVGSSDSNDYYQFTLTQNSNFRLLLNGLSSDADVELLNSGSGVIQSSTNSSFNPEDFTRQLTAGTYYVRVYPFSSNTNYNLTLYAAAFTPPDLAGNLPRTARNIGFLSGNRVYQDYAGTLDLNDYYRFTIAQTSNFSLSLSGLTANANVELLYTTGNVIQGSYGEDTLSESMFRTLNAGSYFIRVYAFNGSSNYYLSLTGTSLVPYDGAGNRPATPRALGPLNGRLNLYDFVGGVDFNDYYRFSLTQNTNFNIALNGLSGNADVHLLNASGGIIQSSAAVSTTPELINRTLGVGTYFIRVFSFSGANTNYQLLLTATPVANPFNTIFGYGLANAAAAVARAIGQVPFANVPDLGGNNWGNDLVNAPEVWARGYTGQGVVVAVVDTGVDYNHPDLSNNIWTNTREIAGNGIDDDRNGFIDDVRGWDFIGRDNNPTDEDEHGTHVSGTIAAGNNGFGVTGVAYNARIMPVRVLGPTGGSNSGVAAGIRYAADNGAHVINLSLGGDLPSTEIEAAVRYATERGSFVVMASGNDRAREGDTQPDFPARYATNYGVSVGAIDINRRAASFSNPAGTNSNLRYVVAPGVDILSTTPNNTYSRLNGTSMAAPHVAGVVALMLSANRNLTHAQIRDILTSSAVRLA